MGDRANVLVICGDEQVCLYTHWGGSELPETLKTALIKGKSRWEDFQYLTRIIFSNMISPHELEETTGYGITQYPHDGKDKTITVNVENQTVQIQDGIKIPFASFITAEPQWRTTIESNPRQQGQTLHQTHKRTICL